MKNALLWWLSLVLLSISLAESSPILSLFLSGFGGAIVGSYRYSSSLKKGLEKVTYPRLLISTVGAVFLGAIVYFYSDFLHVKTFVLLSLFSFLLFSWLVFQTKISIGYNSIVEPLFLLVVSYAISTVLAVDFYSATRYLFYLISGILISICIWVTIDDLFKFELGLFLFMICGIVIVVGSTVFMQIPPEKIPGVSYLYPLWPDVMPRAVHYNYIAGILTLFCPLSVWIFLRKKSILIGFGTFLLLTGLLLTQSRSAILGVGLSIFLTSCFRHGSTRLILMIATASALISTALFFSEISLYVENLLVESTSLSGRFRLWQRALSVVHDFPFTGVGPGSFSLVGSVLYPIIMEDLRTIPHVHNMYLQVVVVAGVPGFVAIWMFIGAFFQMFKQLLPMTQNSQYECYALGLGGGIIAHLTYSLTDAIVLGEIAGILFWMVVGFSCLAFRLAHKEVGFDS